VRQSRHARCSARWDGRSHARRSRGLRGARSRLFERSSDLEHADNERAELRRRVTRAAHRRQLRLRRSGGANAPGEPGRRSGAGGAWQRRLAATARGPDGSPGRARQPHRGSAGTRVRGYGRGHATRGGCALRSRNRMRAGRARPGVRIGGRLSRRGARSGPSCRERGFVLRGRWGSGRRVPRRDPWISLRRPRGFGRTTERVHCRCALQSLRNQSRRGHGREVIPVGAARLLGPRRPSRDLRYRASA
jgi:hypothetical protein